LQAALSLLHFASPSFVTATLSARERLLAYRRALPRLPRLERRSLSVRGLSFAIWSSPPVMGAVPLVCVNGGLLFGHELLWPALAPLAQGRQLVFYDQRGRGATAIPPDAGNARIEHDAADLASLRDAIGLRRWDLLGHSWGGGIALLGAERDRAGVRRLVLVSPVGATSAWLAGLHARALHRLGPTQRAVLQQQQADALLRGDPGVHSAYARALYPAWFADAQMAQSFTPPRSESVTGAAIAARLRRDGYDWSGLVRAIEAPTLVLHGERDLLPPSAAHELVALLPHGRLELIPDCGHMPFWEAPGTFFQTVDSFLTQPLPLTPA
jgi:proline iminopeptidase